MPLTQVLVLEQCCDSKYSQLRFPPKMTLDEAWANLVLQHANQETLLGYKRHCCCGPILVDLERQGPNWATGWYVLEFGRLKPVASDWDSSG